LVDILSSLGVCVSYKEALLYEASSLFHPQPLVSPPQDGCFVQYVCDNADHNIGTLDGLNTFHSMGMIKIISPYDKINDSQQMVRLSKIPTKSEMANVSRIPLKLYDNRGVQGLKTITIKKLDFDQIKVTSMLRNSDVLWLYAKWHVDDVPGWSGFMEILTREMTHTKSRILFLPFINHSPSNYNTIFTTLKYIINDGNKDGHTTCVVTLDQPLYLKTREIIATLTGDPKFSNVFVRLGGFHLLMSYLGSIGYIMADSGLKEIMSVIFAPNSVDKILLGHAYSRAVRAHTLIQITLSQIIFKEISFTDKQKEQYKVHLDNFNEELFENIESSKIVEELKLLFEEKIVELKNRGPTAKLWLQYFEMTALAKEFIRAERMGDWKMHLVCIKRMLPYFHAAGHYNYAKSAHLYVQDMENLENTMDNVVFQKFTKNFFSIKRSNKYFSGTWSDMIIEQSLMKSSKSKGGFTRGRSTNESVLNKWVNGLLTASNISEGLEHFCGLYFHSGEQHVDASDARIKRDVEDVKKLLDWFNFHDPFPYAENIMSIATGVTGDEKINCHVAWSVGMAGMDKKIGSTFGDVKFQRTDRVLSLLTVNSTIKIHDTETAVDPLLLFQRIIVIKRTNEELRNYLEYELAPYPLSLFDEAGMRKTTKSLFYDNFEIVKSPPDFQNATYVIDGGYLLRKVVWDMNQTYDDICVKYVDYVQNHFGSNSIVVFDGYENTSNSVKAMEQLRRSSKSSSVDICFDKQMTVTVSQEKLLSNRKNKTRLISMLTEKFEANNFPVKHAQDDADILIIETAIEQSENDTTVVVGEDIDLLVILSARAPNDKEIFLLKPGKGTIERKIYSSRSFNHQENIKNNVLFLHAFSGCDTTSALFHKGKTAALKLMKKRNDLRIATGCFNNSDTSRETISLNGIKFFLAVYGASVKETSINNHRYSCFTKSVGKGKPVKLNLLPPTFEAAQQHIFRVYYQIQKWLGNELNPLDWGWVMRDNMLWPKTTNQPPAPDCLLHMIFCNCTKGCGPLCGCRRLGLHCSAVCGYCQGLSCLNTEPVEDDQMEKQIMDNTEIPGLDETNPADFQQTIDDDEDE